LFTRNFRAFLQEIDRKINWIHVYYIKAYYIQQLDLNITKGVANTYDVI